MREWIVSRPNEAEKDMLRDAFCTGELIRCKDCNFFSARSKCGHGLCDVHCNGVGECEVVNENDYCSKAEVNEE